MLFKRAVEPLWLESQKEYTCFNLIAGEVDNCVGDRRVAAGRLGYPFSMPKVKRPSRGPALDVNKKGMPYV